MASTRSPGVSAICAAWKRPPFSGTRCAPQPSTAPRLRTPRAPFHNSTGAKLSRAWRTSSFINWRARRRPNDQLLLETAVFVAAQGMDPGAARPYDAPPDHRAADHAAVLVRLCDQYQPETSAHRTAARRAVEIRADHHHGPAEHRLL